MVLACLLMLGAGPALAQSDWDDIEPWDNSQSRPLLERSLRGEEVAETAEEVQELAGGYGLLTPVILAVSRGTELAARRSAGERVGQDEGTVDFLKKKRFWSALTCDLVVTALATGVAAALPGPAFVRALLPVAAGFIGWEIGSGHLAKTDWASLSVQIGAAAAVQIGLTAALIAVPGAGLIAAAGGAVAGIAAGMIFERLRAQPTSDFRPAPEVEEVADPVVVAPPAWGSRQPDGEARRMAADQANRRRGYEAMLNSMRRNDRQGATEAYKDYRGDSSDPQPAAGW